MPGWITSIYCGDPKCVCRSTGEALAKGGADGRRKFSVAKVGLAPSSPRLFQVTHFGWASALKGGKPGLALPPSLSHTH